MAMDLQRSPDGTLILALSLHDFGLVFEAVTATAAATERTGAPPIPVEPAVVRHLDHWVRQEVRGARRERQPSANDAEPSRRDRIVHVALSREDFCALADLVSTLKGSWTTLPAGLYDLGEPDLTRLSAELTRLESAMESAH